MKYTYTNVEPGISLVQNVGFGGDHRRYLVAHARTSYRTFSLAGYGTSDAAIRAAREWIATVTGVGVAEADVQLEEEARQSALREAERCIRAESSLSAARGDVANAMKRYSVQPMHFGYRNTLGWMVMVLLMVGCSYTHPSVAQPDLVEKLSTGHVICYYKTSPSRGYAKCCEDCPMHENQTLTTTGVKP